MERRAFLTALGAGALVTRGVAFAQSRKKLPTVGILRAGPITDAPTQAFLKGLRELGYVESQNILIEYRGGELSQLPALAEDLVALKVDVIFAGAPQAALAARKATATIPIVFAVVGDPVGTGLVASLAHPGGNLTGLTAFGSDLGGKRLDLLKELVPRLARVGVLWNPAVPDKRLEWTLMEKPARALRLQLQSFEVRSPGDFDTAFATVVKGRPQALIVLGEPLMYSNRARLLDFTSKNRLPAMFNWKEFVEAGGLVSYGPDINENNRRAAAYVDKILKGAKPANLPVEQPTKIELAINLKTAKALGLTIPQALLARADQVIQ